LRVALEAALTNLLAPTATAEARRFACQQLAVIGTDNCLPAVAGLLQQPTNVPLACYVLSIHPSRQAGELLRNALLTVPGTNRIPIIDALGHRREAEAAKTIANLTDYADPEVARARHPCLGQDCLPARSGHFGPTPTRRQSSDLEGRAVEASLDCGGPDQRLEPKCGSGHLYRTESPGSAPVHPPGCVRRFYCASSPRQPKPACWLRCADKDAAIKPSAIAAVRTLPGANVSRTFAAELPRLTPDEQVLLIGGVGCAQRCGGPPGHRRSVGCHQPRLCAWAAIQALGAVGDATTVPLLVKAIMRSPTQAEVTAIENALVNLPEPMRWTGL
jgi:hypothetical protein